MQWSGLPRFFLLNTIPSNIFSNLWKSFQVHQLQLISPSTSCSAAFSALWQGSIIFLSFHFLLFLLCDLREEVNVNPRFQLETADDRVIESILVYSATFSHTYANFSFSIASSVLSSLRHFLLTLPLYSFSCIFKGSKCFAHESDCFIQQLC